MNHAEAAAELLRGSDLDTDDRKIATAQVHATLALVRAIEDQSMVMTGILGAMKPGDAIINAVKYGIQKT